MPPRQERRGGESGPARPGAATLIASAALVGILAAGTAVLVRLVLDRGLHLLYGVSDVTVAMGSLELPLRVLAPALGGLAAGAVAWAFARRGSQNVADVMEAVAVGRGRPRLSRAIGPALGSVLAALGGGSIGREGPLIQLGAAMGDLVAHPPRFAHHLRRAGRRAPRLSAALAPFHIPPFTEAQRRALVAAGTAAGFAAAYNTPLAGILFVAEVMLGSLALDLLIPVAVATTLGTLVTRALVGVGPLYGVRDFAFGSGLELFGYAAAGLAAALGGLAFMRILSLGEHFFQRLGGAPRRGWLPALPRPLRAALGGTLVGLILVALPSIAGNGYEPIHQVLDGRLPIATLLVLALAKAVATTASVSSGSPGGVFTPTMLIGASLGAAMASSIASLGWTDGASLGGYALVGMAAALAATTRAPLMATVLVFELSGDYAIALPLLFATALATLVARRLSKESLYEGELSRRGIASRATIGERIARTIKARDVMEPVPACVPADTPLGRALEALAEGRGRLLYVVDAGPLRAISLTTAKTFWRGLMHGEPLPAGSTAGGIASPVLTVSPDDSLVAVGEKLFAVDWGELPVVDPSQPSTALGVVTRRGLLGAFDRELLQRDALMTQVSAAPGGPDGPELLELPDGHRAILLPAPTWMIGHPLDLGLLRTRFGISLIAIRRDTGGDLAPRWQDPDGDLVIAPQDRLMLVATQEELERFVRGPAA